MRQCVLTLMALVVAVSLCVSVSVADVPQMINYQGRLTNDTGDAFNGNATMVFSIYDDSTAGSQLWQEVQAVVVVTDGLFHILLGSSEPIVDSVFNGPDRWLDIVVNGSHIEPRARFVSMAYAHRVSTIDGADGGVITGDVEVVGNLGIGAANDSAALYISASTPDQAGIYVRSTQDAPSVFAYQEGTGHGVAVIKEGASGEALSIVRMDNGRAVEISSALGGGSEFFVVEGDGRVGIGNSSPSEKLHVNGVIYSDAGGFRFPDGSVQTTAATAGSGNWSVTDSVLYTNNFWGIARGGADNAVFGDSGHTMVNLGVACTTGVVGSAVSYMTISGGFSNNAVGRQSAVGGGYANTASGQEATIAGGRHNTASGAESVVAGGNYNQATGQESAIGGGLSNDASGPLSVVCGGEYNTSSGDWSAVCGGETNNAQGDLSAVLAGESNDARGYYSVVLGGLNNDLGVDAYMSMAFGDDVEVNTIKRVVFFDGNGSGRFGLNRDDNNGGIDHPIHVGTNTVNGNGAHLTGGGVWTNGSSREFKENFQPLDGSELLQNVANLQLDSWQYKNSDERHIGPVAEDFVAVFNVGAATDDGSRDDKHLSSGDVAGVALAGVQALLEKIRQLEQRITELEAQNR